MQNDYKGPPAGFAMVVPVPVVLQKENVKTLPRDVFDRVDKLSAPRLVEYWEQDPCPQEIGLGNIGTLGHGAGVGQGFGSGHGRLGGEASVKIEAQFEVGEYEIVILSAKDSTGLDTWLHDNHYAVPANTEPALRPYVQEGSKFFVAKVNVAKVKFEDGRASLSPLRFHYDSDKFELPVRLGMLNSGGTQDLVVHILAPNQRYVVANYPSVTIPTNLDVAEAARGNFGAFYAALFDRTLEKTPGAIVTEYAWPSSSCDPCPGNVSGLSGGDLATLGADVLPSMKDKLLAPASAAPTLTQGAMTVSAGLPSEAVQRIVRQNFGRFRLCYEQRLATNPNLQGTVTTNFEIGASGVVTSAKNVSSDLPDSSVVECVTRAFRGLSFPEPLSKGKVEVVYPIIFAPGGGGGASGVGFGRRGGSFGSFVLTRLHARYAKDTLANDLVFAAAQAIVGGREQRNDKGALETGAAPARTNAFQARYAMRHEWTGAVACKEPRRGVWGGPWPDAGIADPSPLAAQKLAYAPRGSLTLASYVPRGVPELGLVGGAGMAGPASAVASGAPPLGDAGPGATPSGDASAPDDAGAAAPTTSAPSRCGCRVVAASSGAPSGLAALTLGVAALLRRRRSRR
jgi:MYXO-CTERM domain-containing protein